MGPRRHIAGSRILITGASQGIGKALAEALSAIPSAELLRLTRLWLEFDDKVWSQVASDAVRGVGGDAAANLAALLDESREELSRLQARARQARALAESLLKGLP